MAEMIIHELPVPKWGCTHVGEGAVRFNRSTGTGLSIELLPGTMEGGTFVKHPVIGWTDQLSRIGADRWADYVAFTENEFVPGDRPKATLWISAALEYCSLVDLGLRPLPEPEP